MTDIRRALRLSRRHAQDSRCRICGEPRALTKEHIPPRKAFNTERGRLHSIMDWLKRDALSAMRGGIHQQGGVWGYTLCKSCNERTGHRYFAAPSRARSVRRRRR